MLQPVKRLDPNPDVLLFSRRGGLLACAKTREHVLQELVYEQADDGEDVEAFVEKKSRVIHFKVPGKNVFARSSERPMRSGDRVILWTGNQCERGNVISSIADVAHAQEADPSRPNKTYKPVEFKQTKIPSRLWGVAGFESVVLHRGSAYGTLASLDIEAVAATFGKQHETGSIKVLRFQGGKLVEERTFY